MGPRKNQLAFLLALSPGAVLAETTAQPSFSPSAFSSPPSGRLPRRGDRRAIRRTSTDGGCRLRGRREPGPPVPKSGSSSDYLSGRPSPGRRRGVALAFAMIPERRHPTATTTRRRRRESGGGDRSDPAAGKSPESNFWRAVPRREEPPPRGGIVDGESSSSSPPRKEALPAVPGLESEDGPLPPGAYRSGQCDAPCVVTVGILPPPTGDESGVWDAGARNAQKLVDSGFNSFCVRDDAAGFDDCFFDGEMSDDRAGRRVTKRAVEMERELRKRRASRIRRRHEAEALFYGALRRSTPPSVLRGCRLATGLEVPSVLSAGDEGDPDVPFGNGWMVRESVSNALLRVGTDCLDSVVFEYRERSPYHLDVLNALCEMKDEGLVRSVSVKRFPPHLLRSALDCGFGVASNEVRGNLLNPPLPLNVVGGGGAGDCELVASGALAGGLLNDRFASLCADREWSMLSESDRRLFERLFESNRPVRSSSSTGRKRSDAKVPSPKIWDEYRSVVNALTDVAFKHQTSISSVALRYLLQAEGGLGVDGAIASTRLGMDFAEENGGVPYARDRDLRRVFAFALDDEDSEMLASAAAYGIPSDGRDENGRGRSFELDDPAVDFTNKNLWL